MRLLVTRLGRIVPQLEDTPHYNKFDDVDNDLRHQDRVVGVTKKIHWR